MLQGSVELQVKVETNIHVMILPDIKNKQTII